MKIPRPLPTTLASKPFTRQEALDAGVSVGRLRYRDLDSPSRQIRMPRTGTEPDLAERARPLTLVTPFSAASHATAFLLWEFPGFLPGSNLPGIHISRPDTMGRPRRRGVIAHKGQFFEDEITMLNGLYITSRARTWLDCARKMDIDEITVVADHLLRIPRPEFENRTEPYCTHAELEEMLDRHWGTPGIRKARLALEQARVGADSAPETRLRLALERAGLPTPEVNVRTELGSGVVRQPDLGYRQWRVAVDYEGEGHSEPGQIVRDIQKEEDFARAGWILVRIAKRHMSTDAVTAVRKVSRALEQRGWSPN
jgi:very-short-patch-repair endonuclease